MKEFNKHFPGYQFITWFPRWVGFGLWHYPRHSEIKPPIFRGLCLGYFEIRYFSKCYRESKWVR